MFIRFTIVFLILLGACNCVAGQYEFRIDENAQLNIHVEKFNPDDHKITFIENNSSKPLISSIDGMIPFGSKPIRMPESYIKDIELITGNKKYKLQASGMYNPGPEGAFSQARISARCFGENDCVIRIILSDAATMYVAEWVVRYGECNRTILTNQIDIVKKIAEGSMPPIFNE